jgi:hypothetical protein
MAMPVARVFVSHFALVLFAQQERDFHFVHRLASWARRVPAHGKSGVSGVNALTRTAIEHLSPSSPNESERLAPERHAC